MVVDHKLNSTGKQGSQGLIRNQNYCSMQVSYTIKKRSGRRKQKCNNEIEGSLPTKTSKYITPPPECWCWWESNSPVGARICHEQTIWHLSNLRIMIELKFIIYTKNPNILILITLSENGNY